MRLLPVCALVLLFATGCADGGAGERVCPECTLTLERGPRLLPDERVSFLVDTRIVRAANGNLFAAPIASRSSVAIFSPTGEPLGVLGRKGSGPGELEQVVGIYPVGDSIYVVDDGGRVEVFSSWGEWRGSLRTGAGEDAFWPLPGGRMVVRRRGSLGNLAVARRDNSAQVELAPATRDTEREWERRVSVDATGRVWTTLSSLAEPLYRVEVFGPGGDMATGWDQTLREFSSHRQFRKRTHVSRVGDVAFSPPHSLLVLLRRSRRDWRPAAASPRPTSGETPVLRLSVDQVTDRYDNFLDLASSRELRLVARWPLPTGWIGGFAGPNEIFGIEERDDLELVVQLWKLRISSSPGGT